MFWQVSLTTLGSQAAHNAVCGDADLSCESARAALARAGLIWLTHLITLTHYLK
jgi:hypothetical protein